MSLNTAITRGTWSGLVKGMWEHNLLHEDVRSILEKIRQNPKWTPSTAKETGVYDGLCAVGLVERRGWWLFVRSFVCEKEVSKAGEKFKAMVAEQIAARMQ